jgi:hypothetical protein
MMLLHVVSSASSPQGFGVPMQMGFHKHPVTISHFSWLFSKLFCHSQYKGMPGESLSHAPLHEHPAFPQFISSLL